MMNRKKLTNLLLERRIMGKLGIHILGTKPDVLDSRLKHVESIKDDENQTEKPEKHENSES